MDFTPAEIEQMAAGMRQGMEPPTTPEETEDELLTLIRRIVQAENGHVDQLRASYELDRKAITYGANTFAYYDKKPDGELWIEFRMYGDLAKKYRNDPRFAGVRDKDAHYWRVYLPRAEDIEKFKDIVIEETQ